MLSTVWDIEGSMARHALLTAALAASEDDGGQGPYRTAGVRAWLGSIPKSASTAYAMRLFNDAMLLGFSRLRERINGAALRPTASRLGATLTNVEAHVVRPTGCSPKHAPMWSACITHMDCAPCCLKL